MPSKVANSVFNWQFFTTTLFPLILFKSRPFHYITHENCCLSMIYLPKICQKIILVSVKKHFLDHTVTKNLIFKANYGKYN
jgi:hypothetical protein